MCHQDLERQLRAVVAHEDSYHFEAQLNEIARDRQAHADMLAALADDSATALQEVRECRLHPCCSTCTDAWHLLGALISIYMLAQVEEAAARDTQVLQEALAEANSRYDSMKAVMVSLDLGRDSDQGLLLCLWMRSDTSIWLRRCPGAGDSKAARRKGGLH